MVLKLQQKEISAEIAEQVATEYESRGYIDDSRYSGIVIRSHISKGHGPIRIKQALAQKGVDKQIINQVFDQCDCDWYELARMKAQKKYQDKPITEAKERAKRIRFLVGQGFSFDQIAYALDYDPDQ